MSLKEKHHERLAKVTRIGRPSWLAEKKPVLIFGGKFALLIALLYIILDLPVGDLSLYAYLKANAQATNWLLHLTGQPTQVVDGVVIQSARFSMAVRRGCDAVEPTWMVCAAIVAFPAPWRKKLLGLGAAIVLLQMLNLVRLFSLYWIGVAYPSLFNSAHMEWWPTLFILASIVFFLAWKGVSLEQTRSAAP
jgi:exosortase/archaeosortase family protein